MLFQLPSFLIFFVVFAAGLLVMPRALRLNYVLLASLFFYAWWYPPFLAVLLGLILLGWAGSHLVARDRGWLALCVVAGLTPLLVFKYTDFILATLGDLTGLPLAHLGWPLPLGISFVTFSIVSMLIDVAKRRDVKAASLRDTALFVSFFPHLIAGPILRPAQLFPQLPNIRFDWAAFAPHLALFTVGMLKKVMIADPIAPFVDRAFSAADTTSGWEAAVATLGFVTQIYCDFSAYSDMAIALAGMLGVALPENFRSPYRATSITEVWQRWHMTLSLWLRDYLFRPLHARLQHVARYLSIVLTMVLSGLWHGAAWTFVIWGLVLGCIMALEGMTGYSRTARMAKGPARWGFIALALVVWTFTVVLFRAPDLGAAIDIYAGMLGLRGWGDWPAGATQVVVLTAVVLLFHHLDQVPRILAAAARVPAALAVPVLLAITIACALIAAGRPESFYYFDF
ncbi:MBOAT family O-acyltransferase [Zavarzinia sp. CC-PAN008]|uniref:MBOAT family O-acyltransferase n=1 Tax=Zavarzinia sp. CC-PAN008 TaxID=3243332 RepID=UPI003F742828